MTFPAKKEFTERMLHQPIRVASRCRKAYNKFMSIAAGLTATKAAVDVAKTIMDRLNRPEVDVHDVRTQIQEMLIHVVHAQIALSDAQGDIYAAQQSNQHLRAEITALKDTQAIRDELVFGDEVYLRRKADGSLDGPFCPACWDIDRKLVRLKWTT